MRIVAVCTLSLWLGACGTPDRTLPARSPALPGVYTADGQVLGVERPLPQDPAANVHLIFQAKGEAPVRVELGPGWYLHEGKLHFDPKDDVSIEGQRIDHNGDSLVVAKSIRKGPTTLQLRDEHAEPLWSH